MVCKTEGVGEVGQECVSAPADSSEDIKDLAGALAKAQAVMANPKKSHTAKVVSVRTGAKYSYHYADLAEVVDAVRKPLADHGLAFTQIVTLMGTQPVLLTRLLHESGQWLQSVYLLPRNGSAQDMGSAITYARRYSLCAILGIAAEDDEDGQAATEAEEAADAAEAAALEQRRAEASKRLDEAKARGLIKSAHDGRVLKPGEAPAPAGAPPQVEAAPPAAEASAASQPAAKEEQAVAALSPSADSAEGPAVAPLLKVCLVMDGITPQQLKGYYVKKGHFTASVDPDKLPEDYVKKITERANWKRVVATIKGGV